MAKIQESLENKKPTFTFHNDLFMYSNQLRNRLEQSGTDMQDILCELMNVYQSYNDFIQTKQYVVRGSKLKCHFGTEPALLDTIRDHGVYMHGIPVMTCGDCRSWNINNFGSCMCPESLYENRLPMPIFHNSRGEVAQRAPYNKFPHICVPVIDVISGWQQEDSSLKIIDGEEAEDVLTDKAALVCRYGGLIGIVEVFVDEKENKDTKLGELLFQIELPYKNEDFILDDNKKRIAVKPHNANDGYVTIGAGHCIQDDDEAKKYGFSTGQKQSSSMVDQCIKDQLQNYDEIWDNPAILTIDEARLLLEGELAENRKNTIELLEKFNTNHEFADYEIDAITSVLFNGNKINNPNSFVYYLLRPDQYDSEDALNILRTADAKGWYGDNEGLLRRRLMEYNVYFNNDYTYYDSNELEELKDIVGW